MLGFDVRGVLRCDLPCVGRIARVKGEERLTVSLNRPLNAVGEADCFIAARLEVLARERQRESERTGFAKDIVDLAFLTDDLIELVDNRIELRRIGLVIGIGLLADGDPDTPDERRRDETFRGVA